MAISVLKLRDHYNAANRKGFLVDTDSDFAHLPGMEDCAPGSVAYSVETGNRKIMNNAGEWKDKKDSAGGEDDLVDVSVEGM